LDQCESKLERKERPERGGDRRDVASALRKKSGYQRERKTRGKGEEILSRDERERKTE